MRFSFNGYSLIWLSALCSPASWFDEFPGRGTLGWHLQREVAKGTGRWGWERWVDAYLLVFFWKMFMVWMPNMMNMAIKNHQKTSKTIKNHQSIWTQLRLHVSWSLLTVTLSIRTVWAAEFVFRGDARSWAMIRTAIWIWNGRPKGPRRKSPSPKSRSRMGPCRAMQRGPFFTWDHDPSFGELSVAELWLSRCIQCSLL